VLLRLPQPMLARPGLIPSGRGWTFEPKLDGFRCLVCTHAGAFRARSRRGWNMTTPPSRLRRPHGVGVPSAPRPLPARGSPAADDGSGQPDDRDASRPSTGVPPDVLVISATRAGRANHLVRQGAAAWAFNE
jgi:hypothetical protein